MSTDDHCSIATLELSAVWLTLSNGPFWGYLLATIYSRSLCGDTGLGHSTAPLVAVTIGTLRLSSTLKLG